MNNIERIKYYEKLLNEGSDLVERFIKILDEFKEFDSKYQELDQYYSSEERIKDVLDDENNNLPSDLCTGVLGEDYLYNFLLDYEYLKKKIRK